MTPLTEYQQALSDGRIVPDPQQKIVVDALEQIYYHCEQATQRKSFFKRLMQKSPKGLYVWGSVGVGKTFLIDLFYNCLTVPKRRQHFFQFMQDIHTELKKRQGQKNPLQLIAKSISEQTRVICFDEFFVSDIADAMILGELFIALFKEGITLVATSNIGPDDLYKDGLQRQRFLPAIEAINTHCDVIHLTKHYDYRMAQKEPAAVYFTPITEDSPKQLDNIFDYYAYERPAITTPVEIGSRTLHCEQHAGGVLWCDFDALCREAFSQKDYLKIAEQFHTIILSNVPVIPDKERNTILRFIYLIDILYDAHIRLVISADATAETLYPKGPHAFEFKRTASRLCEMQSKHYFHRDDDILQ